MKRQNVGKYIKQKTPTNITWSGFKNKLRQRHTLPHVTVVPSALVSLTSLFGMGRGEPHRNSHLKALYQLLLILTMREENIS